MARYFVIQQTDREAYVIPYNTKKEVLEFIREWENDFADDDIEKGYMRFDELNANNDPAYWGGKPLIIKGEIVEPKPKEVVKEWDI